MVVEILGKERLQSEFKEYEYKPNGDGFVLIKGTVEGKTFQMVIQTLCVLLGRDNPDNDVVFGGSHTKCIHRSVKWIVNILRPAELAWCEADITRIGLCGPKKLSRSHIMLVPVDGGWELTSLSMNVVSVGGMKLADNQSCVLPQGRTTVSLCAGLVTLEVKV